MLYFFVVWLFCLINKCNWKNVQFIKFLIEKIKFAWGENKVSLLDEECGGDADLEVNSRGKFFHSLKSSFGERNFVWGVFFYKSRDPLISFTDCLRLIFEVHLWAGCLKFALFQSILHLSVIIAHSFRGDYGDFVLKDGEI